MRDIKFRVWDKVNKRMIDEILGGILLRDPGEFEIMQFTGLKDKNGRDIWEGDILLIYGEKKTVEYYCACFFVNHIGENYLEELCEYFPNEKCVADVEVLGNIYENGELLK